MLNHINCTRTIRTFKLIAKSFNTPGFKQLKTINLNVLTIIF